MGPLNCFGGTHDKMILLLKLDLEGFMNYQKTN